MNKIYKIIWSHSCNAFVVVSELARSHSGGGSTTGSSSAIKKGRVTQPWLTTLASSVALALGLSASAWAQEEAKPGGSVLEKSPTAQGTSLIGFTVKNTAYGNALLISSGSGLPGSISINGGAGSTLEVTPTAPDADRAGDDTPYAALMVTTTADQQVFLAADGPENVKLNVQGDKLHGIHLANSSTWLASNGTEITASGEDNIGVYAGSGVFSSRYDQIQVTGKNATGARANNNGSIDIANETQIQIKGTGNLSGIDVRSSRLKVHDANASGGALSLDLSMEGTGAGTHATGVRFSGTNVSGGIHNSAIKITNQDTANSSSGGVAVLGSSADPITIADTTIDVQGNIAYGIGVIGADASLLSTDTKITTSGARTTGIDVLAGTAVILGNSIDVTGGDASGITVSGGGLAEIAEQTKITVTGDGQIVNGINVIGSELLVHGAATGSPLSLDLNVTGTGDHAAYGLRFEGAGAKGDINNSAINVLHTGLVAAVGVRINDIDPAERINIADTRITAKSNSRAVGVQLDKARAGLTSATDINVNSTKGIGVDARNGSNVVLDNANIITNGTESVGIYLDKSAAEITGQGVITAIGKEARGLVLESEANVKLTGDNTILAEGEDAIGIDLYESTATIDGNTQLTVQGSDSHGIYADAGSNVTINGASIVAEGTSTNGISLYKSDAKISGNTKLTATGIYSTGIDSRLSQLAITGADIAVVGAESKGLNLLGSTTTLTGNTTVNAEGDKSIGIHALHDSELTIDGANIATNGANAMGMYLFNSTADITNSAVIRTNGDNNVALTGEGSDAHFTLREATLTAEDLGATAVRLIREASAEITTGYRHIGAKGLNALGLSLQEKASVNLVGDNEIFVEGEQTQGISLNDSTATIDGNTKLTVVSADGVATGVDLRSDAELAAKGLILEAYADNGMANGILSNASKVSLIDSKLGINSATDSARGILALNDSSINLNNTSVKTSSSSADAWAVTIANSSLTAANNALIEASGSKNSIMGIYADNSTVELTDTQISIEGTQGANAAIGILATDTAVTLKTNQITAKIDGREATGIKVTGAGSKLSMADTSVDSNAGLNAYGITTTNVQDIQINNSQVSATSTGALGNGEVSALHAQSSNLSLTNSQLYATNNQSGSSVTALHLSDTTATVNGSRIEAAGANGTAVYAESGADNLTLNLTDTELVASGSSLIARLLGTGEQTINLGAGVVATDNDGTLLNVLRDINTPTGRVDFNITGTADVAGDIRDSATSLADLTATGGTYLMLDAANYHGNVHNVRELSLTNGARIGGGLAATPNILLADMFVNASVLSGHWNIAGTLNAQNGSRIAPGNSIGTITTNNINWGPGTVLEVEVNAAGQADLVQVTGAAAADISNTELQVKPEIDDNDYRLGHNYTILTATGGVLGEFTSASWTGNTLLEVNPIYGANSVMLSLGTNQALLDLANLTANQRATANSAIAITGLNTAAEAAFLSNNPAAAFDMLSGEIHPSTRAGLINSSTGLSGTVLDHWRSAPAKAEQAGEGQSPVWVSYTHSRQDAKGDSNTDKRRNTVDSLVVGGEIELNDGWKAGAAFAYDNSHIKLDQRDSSAKTDSYGLALYSGKSWQQGDNTLNAVAGVGHSWHSIETKRSTDLGGAQTLKADYDARTTQVFGELSYTLPTGQDSVVEPYLDLTWLQHKSDSFSEKGGSAALRGKNGTDNTTFSTLGVRSSTVVAAGETELTLQAGLGWRHAFGDRQPDAKLAFIEGNSSSFAVEGAPLARNSAALDFAASMQTSTNTRVGLSYGGQLGGGAQQHSGGLFLETRF